MKKITTEQFIEKCHKIHNNRYDYSLINYINNNTKIRIICPKHGIFEQLPRKHSSGQGCPLCYLDKINIAKIEFINKSNKIHNNYYNYSLVKYINNRIKVEIICPKHGVFNQSPDSHLRKHGCPKCKITKLKKDFSSNKKDFAKKSNKVHNNRYDYSLVRYINDRTKVKIICPKHGIFEQQPLNHLNNQGCPRCNDSKGEKIIKKILENNNIKFIQQKKFKSCKHKKELPFDFYLIDYNICLEYDGKHHYYSNNFFGGDNQLKIQQKLDNIKTEYCKNNNIELIRIKYDDSILEKLDFLKLKNT